MEIRWPHLSLFKRGGVELHGPSYYTQNHVCMSVISVHMANILIDIIQYYTIC